jgi:hypothetical protein
MEMGAPVSFKEWVNSKVEESSAFLRLRLIRPSELPEKTALPKVPSFVTFSECPSPEKICAWGTASEVVQEKILPS